MGILYSWQFSSLCSLLPLLIFTSQLAKAENTPQNFHYFCDSNNRGNYTTNSTYATNLNVLLSTLTSNTEITYGFFNFSYGENSNKIKAIGLCRGDIRPNQCRSCLTSSRANLTQLCPNQKEAIGWFEDELCMLRYSDHSIFNQMETGPTAYYAYNMNNASDLNKFKEVLRNLLSNLTSKAASGDSRIKYDAGSVRGPNNQTVYGLVQCTPDLSREQCDDCLAQSIAQIPNCCDNRVGARYIRPSCSVRYETNSIFYEPTIASPSSPSTSPLPLAPPPSLGQSTFSKDKGKTSKTTVSVVSLLLFLLYSFLSISI